MSKSLKFENASIYDTSVHKFKKGSLKAENGIITEVSYGASASGSGIDLGGMYVLPGMVDIHTHGRAGFDFPRVTAEQLDTVRKSYAQAGTTTFMATIGSCPLDDAYSLIALLRRTPDKNGLANIGGMHFEGRYISLKRKGAHHPSLLAPLDAAEIKAQLDYAHSEKDGERPLVTHVTAAPELEGGRAFIEAVTSTGATFSVGHSDATYEEAMNAVKWGAIGFSHFFNGMSPLHHRETGCIGAGLLSDAYTELICDGYHLSRETVRIVHKMKSSDKVVLVTDSCMAAGLPDGVYEKLMGTVYVKDGHVTLEDGTISGSTLNLFDGMKNYAEFCGIPIEESIPLATINPAKMVKLDGICGSIEVGKRADLLVCTPDMKLESVYVSGDRVQ